MKQRIVFLDVFRFLLVTAALFSHVLGRFDTWGALNNSQVLYLRLFTRGATPGLLILFGFMIEYIYVKYAKRDGLSFSVNRMVYRAILCYFALVLVAVAGTIGLQTGFREFVASILLVSPTINGDVFALYFYVLFAMMPIIVLRLRYGIRILLMVIAGIWLSSLLVLDPINHLIGGSLYDLHLSHIVGFLTGLGDARGPSVFHGLTVVLFGMVLGNVFTYRSRESMIFFSVLTVIALFILGYEILSIGWLAFLRNIADYNAYRAHNSIIYFAYGIIYTLFLLALAFGINKLLHPRVREVVTYLGTRTFIYFLTGNIILNLLPNGYTTISLWLSVGETTLIVAVCYILIKLWESRVNTWRPIVVLQHRISQGAKSLTAILRKMASLSFGPRVPHI